MTPVEQSKSKGREGGILISQVFVRCFSLFIIIWLLACAAVLKYDSDLDVQKKSTEKLWGKLRSEFTSKRNNKNVTSSSSVHSGAFGLRMPLQFNKPKGSLIFSFSVKKPEGQMTPKYLILKLLKRNGKKIRLSLRPDLSAGSVDYVIRLVRNQCANCAFHRITKIQQKSGSEDGDQGGLLLGTMANHKVPLNSVPGTCPDKKSEKNKACKDCDCKDCECHGPILKRGMFGWAGRTSGGPDFFVNLYENHQTDLGTSFTVFGRIDHHDHESFKVVEELLNEDTSFQKAMVFDEKIHFDLELE
jgi:hypothetical protein